MNEHGMNNRIIVDAFHEVATDQLLFGSVGAYKDRLQQYKAAIATGSVGRDERTRMELALIWIELVRGTLDSENIIDWENFETSVKQGDELLRNEYAIVKATHQLLIENDFDTARMSLEQVIQVLTDSSYNYLYAIAARALCSVYVMTGNTDRAEIYAQDSISIFRRYDNKLLLASCMNSYAILKKNCCYYDEAERLLVQAIGIFREIDAPDGEFLCMNNLAVIKMKTGGWEGAEHYFEKLRALEDQLNIKSNNLLIYKVNHAHLQLLKRNFIRAEAILSQLADDSSSTQAMKQKALAHEFLGELYIEQAEYEKARIQLEKADNIAAAIAPDSDLMTEIWRRKAQLHLNLKDIKNAKTMALKCIRLCRSIKDWHELGAALRILGNVHIEGKQPRKAKSALEYSGRILRSIKEEYELMRTYCEMAALLPGAHKETESNHLFEAKNIAQRLGLDYYLAHIMILIGNEAGRKENFGAARSCLRKAREFMETLGKSDCQRVNASLNDAYRKLDKIVMAASVGSAQKLKILGKIFEEARFPVEEAGPRLATEVARAVNAESLFLVKKRNGGYVIPVKYNISIDNAKRLVKRLVNGSGARLFGSAVPRISGIGNGRKLVSVSSSAKRCDSLCIIMDETRRPSQEDMEFFIACSEALERVAEEQLSRAAIASEDRTVHHEDPHPGESFREITTVDLGMIRLINLVKRASHTDVPILLQGETGVGKELFARAIHDASPRRDRVCVAINTGGIPVNFLESELFGHVKGAFTDARVDKTGLIEDAYGGTLFLDEIGDMCEEIQIKLLRLIENGEYRRLGENSLRKANVRIVSATNKDIPSLVEQGKFREDLYYRISTVRFTIPPLRYRQCDIELLIRVLLENSLRKLELTHKRIEIDNQAKEALKLYDWPGNVRELQNEMLRLVSLMGTEEIVRFAMLSKAIQSYFQTLDRASHHERKMDLYERMLIIKALEENDWNRFRTAEEIGIPRTTLLAKMRRLNITA